MMVQTTKIEQMLRVFRRFREVPEHKECWVAVDGDRLSIDKAVQHCDIEDMDTIDVHIK